MDDLDSRIKDGELSPDELAQARIELDEIVGAMPTDAREVYEELQAARDDPSKLSYQAADGVFSDTLPLKSHFEQAASKFAESKADPPDGDLDRKPVYIPAPME